MVVFGGRGGIDSGGDYLARGCANAKGSNTWFAQDSTLTHRCPDRAGCCCPSRLRSHSQESRPCFFPRRPPNPPSSLSQSFQFKVADIPSHPIIPAAEAPSVLEKLSSPPLPSEPSVTPSTLPPPRSPQLTLAGLRLRLNSPSSFAPSPAPAPASAPPPTTSPTLHPDRAPYTHEDPDRDPDPYPDPDPYAEPQPAETMPPPTAWVRVDEASGFTPWRRRLFPLASAPMEHSASQTMPAPPPPATPLDPMPGDLLLVP